MGQAHADSCCPDILSCLHLPADFLVHYGHACLTPWVTGGLPPVVNIAEIRRTDAIPVHYVFPRRKVELDSARQGFMAVRGEVLADDTERTGVIVVWDVAYDWAAGMDQRGVA